MTQEKNPVPTFKRFKLEREKEQGMLAFLNPPKKAFLALEEEPDYGISIVSTRAGILWIDQLFHRQVIDGDHAGELRSAVNQASYLPRTTPPVFQLFIGADDNGPFAYFQRDVSSSPTMKAKYQVRDALETMFQDGLIGIEEYTDHCASLNASQRLPEGERPEVPLEAILGLLIAVGSLKLDDIHTEPGQPRLVGCIGHYHLKLEGSDFASDPIDDRKSGYRVVSKGLEVKLLTDAQVATLRAQIDAAFPAS